MISIVAASVVLSPAVFLFSYIIIPGHCIFDLGHSHWDKIKSQGSFNPYFPDGQESFQF